MKIFQFIGFILREKRIYVILIFSFVTGLILLGYLYYQKEKELQVLEMDQQNMNDKIEKLKEKIMSLDGLAAYYPLNEISGDAINQAPATCGALNGIVNGAKQEVEGLAGNAYSFDGVDDEIIVNYDPVIDITGDEISLFALIQLDSLPSIRRSQMQVIKHLRSLPTSGGYQMEVNGTDKNYPNEIRLNVRGADDNYLSGNGVTLETGKWYFVVVTYDGEKMNSYVNGVNDKTNDTKGELDANPQDLIIGGQCDSLNNFHGLIQHVGILNRCLTYEEITDLTRSIF